MLESEQKSDLHSNQPEFEDVPAEEWRNHEQESKGRDEKRNKKRKHPTAGTETVEALKRRILDLETELEKKDDLVEHLTQALESSREAHEAKDLELEQVTQNLLPLAESLQKMQQQLDEREEYQARERESVEEQFGDLVQQLEAAREALQAKEKEIQILQHENDHLKEEIEKKAEAKERESPGEATEGGGHRGEGAKEVWANGDEDVTEEEDEETIGEAAGPPVRAAEDVANSPRKDRSNDTQVEEGGKLVSATEEEKAEKSDPLDRFKEQMEMEFKKINDSLQNANQFQLMFSKKTMELTSNIVRIKEVRELEKEKVKIEEGLASEGKGQDANDSADDGFEQKIKGWPREMVEKQLKHYRDAFNAERKSLEEMEEEKLRVEEELMSAKLELEQKQLEVATLQSGKEQLEQYVAQLAEEMEKETSQMVSMKEQFQVETLKFTDFSTYLTSDSESEAAEGEESDAMRSQGSSALPSPSVSPITPRARGEGLPSASRRDSSKRRSLNFDLSTSNGAVQAGALKGKERAKTPRGRMGASSSSSGTNGLSASARGEDEDTGTEGMYSEDDVSREGTDDMIIGRYREEVSQLREELRTVREELQHAREERERKGTEMRAQLEEKDGKIRLLEDELRQKTSEYESFTKRNSELEEEGRSSSQEIDVLKKELFFSLAVAIKLNLSLQGRKCNVGIASLYETASGLNKHHSEWSEWILQQLMEAEEPEQPRGLRALLGRSSTLTRSTNRT